VAAGTGRYSLSFEKDHSMIGFIPIVVVLSCAIIASITDVSKFKVYNVLTFPCFFGGLLYGYWVEGFQGLWLAFLGAILGLAILLLPYLMGGLGAGDVKFVMAMGTWLGPAWLIPAILIGCVATVCYFFAFIGRTQGWRGVWNSFQLLSLRLAAFSRNFAGADVYESVSDVARQPNARGRLIPFSAMISMGVVISLIAGVVWSAVR
jgi:Flp pilus assembly protein protease CpaA